MHLARREEFPRKRVREGFLNAEPGSRKEKKRVTYVWRTEGVSVADYLLGADQEIPDGPTKTTFLGRLKLLLG